jgi:nucleoside phosphorylase/tetratricopeptide (TPR) repeat protein
MAILCALPREFDAAVAVLDEVWDDDLSRALGKTQSDRNTYVTGRMGPHNIVLVLLPKRMGSNDAGVVASDLRHSYHNLRLTLIVGICGGAPKNGDKEILLGDVVISNSLVQYDFGREYSDGFERKKGAKDNMAELSGEVAGIITMVEKTRLMAASLRQKTVSCLEDLQEREPGYRLPDPATDRLFQPDYRHKHHVPHPDCEPDNICQSHVNEDDPVCKAAKAAACDDVGCDESLLVPRCRLEERVAAFSDSPDAHDAVFNPEIHIGAVGCGNKVMKSAVKRDKVAAEEGIIAFEMEGSGVWEHMPCLVIKGVCDYADSHKNKDWQDYAAGTAACVAKALFSLLSPTDRKPRAAAISRKLGWIVPFPPDPDFVDQPEISGWLREKSQVKGARVALVGLGGIGKSQLAIQFAYGIRKRSHVFWLNASTRDLLEQSYCAIAKKMKLGGPENSTDDTIRLVADWLSDDETGQWTVILDNFDDPTILGEDDPQLLTMLPYTDNGFTLITSRTLHAAELLTGEGNNTYSVEPMSEELAVKLFQTKLNKPCAMEDAEEVVRLLSNMPLAISQAAAYINRCTPRTSAQEYAKSFMESDDRRSVLLGSEYNDLRRHSSSGSIMTTWTLTFFEIRNENRSALDLLSLLSFFSPQSIPEWAVKGWYTLHPSNLPRLKYPSTVSPSLKKLLESVSLGRRYLGRKVGRARDENLLEWDDWMRAPSARTKQLQAAKKKKSRFSFGGASSESNGGYDPTETYSDDEDWDAGQQYERDIHTLLGYSIVSYTTEDNVLKMHPLVQYCTQEWLKQSGRMDTWKKRFMMVMAASIDDPRARERSPQGLMVHFTPILNNDNPEDLPAARLWVQVAFFVCSIWKEMGSVEASTGLVEKVIEVASRMFGPGDRTTLGCLMFYAVRLADRHDYDKAEEVYQDLLARAQESGESESYPVHESRLLYAHMLRDLDRLDEALEIISEVVERQESTVPPDVDMIHWSRGNLADVLSVMGRYEEAAKIATEILRVDWTADGRDPHFYERAVTCSAAVALNISQNMPGEESEPLLREMAEAAEAHPDSSRWFTYIAVGHFHFNLAQSYSQQGKLAEEASTLDRGMKHMAELFPMPSEPTLQPPTLIDDLLEGEDDSKETRQRLLQEIIENLRRENWESRPFYWGIANVSRRLYNQRRIGEAFELANALYRRLREHPGFGENHLVTTRTQGFLDNLYWVNSRGCWLEQEPGTLPDKEEAHESAPGDSGIDEAVGDLDLSE